MLNLEPLELRRLRFDLVMYYKFLHGLMFIDVSSHLTYYYPPICLAWSAADTSTEGKAGCPSKQRILTAVFTLPSSSLAEAASDRDGGCIKLLSLTTTCGSGGRSPSVGHAQIRFVNSDILL
jgi:hypothetical protein